MNSGMTQDTEQEPVKLDVIEAMQRFRLIDGLFIVHDLASDAATYIECASSDISKRLEWRLSKNARKAIDIVEMCKMGTRDHVKIAKAVQLLISGVYNLIGEEDVKLAAQYLARLGALLKEYQYTIKDH